MQLQLLRSREHKSSERTRGRVLLSGYILCCTSRSIVLDWKESTPNIVELIGRSCTLGLRETPSLVGSSRDRNTSTPEKRLCEKYSTTPARPTTPVSWRIQPTEPAALLCEHETARSPVNNTQETRTTNPARVNPIRCAAWQFVALD